MFVHVSAHMCAHMFVHTCLHKPSTQAESTTRPVITTSQPFVVYGHAYRHVYGHVYGHVCGHVHGHVYGHRCRDVHRHVHRHVYGQGGSLIKIGKNYPAALRCSAEITQSVSPSSTLSTGDRRDHHELIPNGCVRCIAISFLTRLSSDHGTIARFKIDLDN